MKWEDRDIKKIFQAISLNFSIADIASSNILHGRTYISIDHIPSRYLLYRGKNFNVLSKVEIKKLETAKKKKLQAYNMRKGNETFTDHQKDIIECIIRSGGSMEDLLQFKTKHFPDKSVNQLKGKYYYIKREFKYKERTAC